MANKNEPCMSHQGGQLKQGDCWSCKSDEEKKEILERILGKGG